LKCHVVGIAGVHERVGMLRPAADDFDHGCPKRAFTVGASIPAITVPNRVRAESAIKPSPLSTCGKCDVAKRCQTRFSSYQIPEGWRIRRLGHFSTSSAPRRGDHSSTTVRVLDPPRKLMRDSNQPPWRAFRWLGPCRDRRSVAWVWPKRVDSAADRSKRRPRQRIDDHRGSPSLP
jgi:hypothetical protein